eukprot:2391888-Lingulodinium_polyedra.AAC.1
MQDTEAVPEGLDDDVAVFEQLLVAKGGQTPLVRIVHIVCCAANGHEEVGEFSQSCTLPQSRAQPRRVVRLPAVAK